MTLRHLQIFLAVADAGNMTRASKTLFIAQPTVSQAIAELEKHYGVKLFDRLSRRLYLTGTGAILLGYARHVINLVGEMDQAIAAEADSGSLRIGATLTIGTCLLPDYLAIFARQYPQVSVTLNGLGIAVLSRRLIEAPLQSGQLKIIQVEDLELIRSFCLAHHKNKYLTPAMQALAAIIRQAVA